MAELTPLCPLLEPGSRETDLAEGGADRAFSCPGSRDGLHCPHWFDSIGAACHWCGAGASRTAARDTPPRPPGCACPDDVRKAGRVKFGCPVHGRQQLVIPGAAGAAPDDSGRGGPW